jgi:hypothetical protein
LVQHHALTARLHRLGQVACHLHLTARHADQLRACMTRRRSAATHALRSRERTPAQRLRALRACTREGRRSGSDAGSSAHRTRSSPGGAPRSC